MSTDARHLDPDQLSTQLTAALGAGSADSGDGPGWLWPALLRELARGRPVTLEALAQAVSTTPGGEPVRLSVDPTAGVTALDPATAVVSVLIPDTRSGVRAAFCNQTGALLRHPRRRPGLAGRAPGRRRAAGRGSLRAGPAPGARAREDNARPGPPFQIAADEAMTPALGFSAPNRAYPLSTHLRAYVAHLGLRASRRRCHRSGLVPARPPPPDRARRTPMTTRSEETRLAEDFDAIVIGMGPGGEVAASRLLAGGKRVAIIERELIGGECGYWACIPSKTLLRPTEARAEAAGAAGLNAPELDWAALRDYRDTMIRYLDDAKQVDGYRGQGATVIKGEARLAGPGRVDVAGHQLRAEHVVLAAGSTPVRPPHRRPRRRRRVDQPGSHHPDRHP